jgi:hypothetical protein
MGRTILVGDVHGCARELEDLLAYVGWTTRDRLVLVGDLVVRGPKPHGVIELCRALGAQAVRGNHEDRLLRWRRSRGTPAELRVSSLTRRTAEALKPRDWEYIESLPLWLDLPDHNVRVVHAGLVPGRPIEEQDARSLLYIRALGPRGEAVEARGQRSWAHLYEGPEHVVFGHNAKEEPEIAEHATGLDTGVVYGGRLTAMVLRAGERPPIAAERRSVLVSIPARKAYYRREERGGSSTTSGEVPARGASRLST